MNTATPENTWVFLSHSNEDFDKLTVIRNKLEKLGYRPLLFYLKCLDNDDEITDLIYREIDARERFILCDSKNAKKSKWVQKEVNYIKSKERPYEIIDLEDKASIKKGIERFNQRSTVYVVSTEQIIISKVIGLLNQNAFKVSGLNIFNANNSQTPVVNNLNTISFCLANMVSGSAKKRQSEIVKGAYLIVLISRELNEEENTALKQFITDYKMKAFAYEFEENPFIQNKYGRNLHSDLFINRKNIKDTKEADTICFTECIWSENLANTIVSQLLCWDITNCNGKEYVEDLPTSDIEKLKVGQIVNQILRNILQNSPKVTLKDILDLQDKAICKSIFNVNYPVLVDINGKYDKQRYYVKPVIIKGKKYKITKEWYEKHRNPLETWIKAHS